MDIAKKQKGFSLMEVLMVIAIMGIMVAVITPNYFANKRAKAMSLAKTQIVNDLRYAQDSTLSGMKFPGASSPPSGGYGVNLRTGSSSFIIFGDDSPNKTYNSGMGGDRILETVDLGNGIYISKLEQCTDRNCSSPSSISRVDYVCVPPYGGSFINNNTAGYEAVVRVTLSSSDGKMQSSFIVSSSGYTSYTS